MPIQASVLDRFSEMVGLDQWAFSQVGDRAGDPQDLGVGASGQ